MVTEVVKQEREGERRFEREGHERAAAGSQPELFDHYYRLLHYYF